jgi:hypothetical protein
MRRFLVVLAASMLLLLSAFQSGASAKVTGGCPSGDDWQLVTVASLGISPEQAAGIPSIDGNGDGWTCASASPAAEARSRRAASLPATTLWLRQGSDTSGRPARRMRLPPGNPPRGGMTGAALRRLQDGDSGPAHRPYLETVGRAEEALYVARNQAPDSVCDLAGRSCAVTSTRSAPPSGDSREGANR